MIAETGPGNRVSSGVSMAKKTKSVARHLDLWADLAAAKALNRKLRQQNSDLKWECRALRVQLYAEKTYAEKFAAHHRRDERRRSGDPVDAVPDRGEVTT